MINICHHSLSGSSAHLYVNDSQSFTYQTQTRCVQKLHDDEILLEPLPKSQIVFLYTASRLASFLKEPSLDFYLYLNKVLANEKNVTYVANNVFSR